uniref:serine/threonine-protein kinase n=1 Tax=Streptomyces corallincola TaxID=2851888 RepID=UPI0027E2B185|nr:serine/threonine-protein kinase [Streptomyces corallincola]
MPEQDPHHPADNRVIADRYRLLTPLGEGGMGTVWRARDEVLHREVAVKEVRAPAGLSTQDLRRMYARLEREAWAAARISDRNVVTVYDVATDDGRPWIVMELVRGMSLADRLDAEGPLPPETAAHIGAEVLGALRAAHDVGVLHRDVKPANVLLGNDGRVVLTDFGIAAVEGTSAITMTGEVIGSPEFLPPERALGRTPGPESDLWSLGVLLYAAVEGASPFRRDTALNTLRAVVDEELPVPERAGPLAPVIEGLLRKDPAERTPAETAERELRIVAAGGTAPRTTRTTPLSTAPAVAAPHDADRDPGRTPPLPLPVSRPTRYPDPATTTTTPERAGRARAVLAAGVAVLVLAVAGLAYALLHDRGGDDSGKEAKGGASPTGTATGQDRSPTPSATTPTTTAPSHTGSPSSEAAQTVRVSLSGSRTRYEGTCPPPSSQAPAFTATFTVGRTPAQVTYRWVTGHGSLVDDDWHTVSFGADDGRSRRERLSLTAPAEGGPYRDTIRVEVRSPVRTTSNAVEFSLSCTPAGTPTESESASPSESASATP